MRSARGFTMVELSIVLVIIAAITGMGIMATRGALDSAKVVSTNRKLDTIERALWAYRLANNRLPCPGDVTYGPGYISGGAVVGGVEANNAIASNIPPGLCSGGTIKANFVFRSATNSVTPGNYSLTDFATVSVEGGVPVKTLGLPDEYLYDAWGRMFAYAVDVRLTTPSGFTSFYPPNVPSLMVCDGSWSGLPRDSNIGYYVDYPSYANCTSWWGLYSGVAAYVLLSYGPDGYGGYVANPGGINTQIATCTSTGTYCVQYTSYNNHDYAATNAGWSWGGAAGEYYVGHYYQMDPVEDPTGGSNDFDDIVRFKSRNELFSYDDGYNFVNGGYNTSGYRGPPFFYTLYNAGALPYDSYIVPTILPQEMGAYTSPTSFGSLLYTASNAILPASTNVVAMALTPDNRALFFYSNWSSYNCAFYTINGMTMSAFGFYDLRENTPVTPTAISNCPSAYTAANQIAMSNNGYLAIIDTSGTKIRISKWNGSTFIALPNITGVTPTMLAFSRNANYLVISDGTAANTVAYRRNSNNTWTALTVANGFSPVNGIDYFPTVIGTQIFGIAFSPNGKYFAIIGSNLNAGALNNKIAIWPINTALPKDPFNSLSSVIPANNAGPTQAPTTAAQGRLLFSPDSNYIYAGGGANATLTNAVKIYKLDLTSTAPGIAFSSTVSIDDTDKYTTSSSVAHNPSTYAPIASGSAWSSDSNYLAISMQGTWVGSLEADCYILNRISTLNFEQTPPITQDMVSGGIINHGVAMFH